MCLATRLSDTLMQHAAWRSPSTASVKRALPQNPCPDIRHLS